MEDSLTKKILTQINQTMYIKANGMYKNIPVEVPVLVSYDGVICLEYDEVDVIILPTQIESRISGFIPLDTIIIRNCKNLKSFEIPSYTKQLFCQKDLNLTGDFNCIITLI